MRFFTFFAVASAIAVCSNAASNGKREEVTCASTLRDQFKNADSVNTSIRKIKWSRALVLDTNIGPAEANIIKGFFKENESFCCKAFGTSSVENESNLKLLGEVVDMYLEIMKYAKSQKYIAEDNSFSMMYAQHYLKTISSGFTSLFDCVNSGATVDYQTTIAKLKSKFSEVDIDARKAYGV